MSFQEEYAKAYYAALMQRQQEALSVSDTQLPVEQEVGAPDRVVGMKAKRENEGEEEDGVEWEESAGTLKQYVHVLFRLKSKLLLWMIMIAI